MDVIKKADGFANEYLFVLPDSLILKASNDRLFDSLLVTDIGFFPQACYHYRARSTGCDTAILLYCRGGTGTIQYGTKPEHKLEAGQAIIIPPYLPHWYGASQENPWSVFWVHFRGALIEPYLRLIGDSSLLHILPQFDGDIIREFYRCFDILKIPYEITEYFLVCQSVGSILAFLADANKQHARQLTQNGQDSVERCIRFMKTNLSQTLNLKQMATVSGFSTSHFNMLFKQSTGSAPMEYFLRLKMHAASKELYFTKRSVKEIAIDFGIQDPYYFSRLFKRVMGMSPVAYREQTIRRG